MGLRASLVQAKEVVADTRPAVDTCRDRSIFKSRPISKKFGASFGKGLERIGDSPCVVLLVSLRLLVRLLLLLHVVGHVYIYCKCCFPKLSCAFLQSFHTWPCDNLFKHKLRKQLCTCNDAIWERGVGKVIKYCLSYQFSGPVICMTVPLET